MNEWTKEKENKILKRSKWLLTFKILRILLLVGLGYIVYMMAILLVSEERGTKYEDAYFVKVTTSMNYPNVFVDDFYLKNDSLNTLGTRNFSNALMKRVGREESLIGEVNISKRLFNSYSTIQYEHPGRERLNEFSFILPSELTKDANTKDEASQAVWQRLEKLPEGTVGELKLTTNAYMSPEQLLEKLKAYDVDVIWMPLLTGEFESFTPNAYSGSGQMVSIQDKIGLYGGHNHATDSGNFRYRSGTTIYRLTPETIEDSKAFLLANLKEMLDKKKGYYERFLGISYLEERYDYLQSNGFQVYGAVVTGPTKELLKLRIEQGIHEVQLGDVALWNWE